MARWLIALVVVLVLVGLIASPVVASITGATRRGARRADHRGVGVLRDAVADGGLFNLLSPVLDVAYGFVGFKTPQAPSVEAPPVDATERARTAAILTERGADER